MVKELNKHWTDRSIDDYLFRLSADFVRQVEDLLSKGTVSQSALARKLGVSESRVSQVLNDPGNLTLKQIIKYAMALGQKVSVITYDDGDSGNLKGPIFPEVFVSCWEKSGRPTDFFELSAVGSLTTDSTKRVRNESAYSYDDRESRHPWNAEQTAATKGRVNA